MLFINYCLRAWRLALCGYAVAIGYQVFGNYVINDIVTGGADPNHFFDYVIGLRQNKAKWLYFFEKSWNFVGIPEV